MFNLLEKIFKRNAFHEIFQGKIRQKTFSDAIHYYQTLSIDIQTQLSEKTYKKLNRTIVKTSTLSCLILCDFLSTINPQFCPFLPQKLLLTAKQKKKINLKTLKKEEKILISFDHFVSFYAQFLKFKIWSGTTQVDINFLQESIQYCQNAVQGVKLFLQYDFIVEFSLRKNQQNRRLLKIATENILRRISEDLSVMISFLQKWQFQIFNQANYSFRINKIYENLIFFGKNIVKFQQISKKIDKQLSFPSYQINKQLNARIQKKMLEKNEEKMTFYSEISEKLLEEKDSHSNMIMIKKKTVVQSDEDINNTQICFNAKKMI